MSSTMRIFQGIGASPGVVIGRVFLLDRGKVKIPRYHIEAKDTAHEIARLNHAIAQSIEQLTAIQHRLVGHGVENQAILKAHDMMLRDKALEQEAVTLIEHEHLNAEWSIQRVISRIRHIFHQLSDSYLRERGDDINFVGERILRNLVQQHTYIDDNIEHVIPNTLQTVVIARDLSPIDTALLIRHNIASFVTEVGTKTSHTAIIARSLEVPAVVGAHGIFDAAGSDDVIIVNGLNGHVCLRPSSDAMQQSHQHSIMYKKKSHDITQDKDLPAQTQDYKKITISGNIEIPSEVSVVMQRGGESIGLYRTEFMFLSRDIPPTEEEHYKSYCNIFADAGHRPVTIRTLDIGADKMIENFYPKTETNPALGLRAIRFCLQNLPIFENQIAGLLRAATQGDLRIMLPMISCLHELKTAKEIISQVMHRLDKQGRAYKKNVPIGIMIEVPSAAIISDVLAQECDFFSVGTNDLLQYLLAIDRSNDQVAYLYNPLHPAVLRMLRMIIQNAQEANIPFSVCGEIAGDTDMTPMLIGLGFEHLSMNAGSIPKVKQMIRKINYQACKNLLDACLELKNTENIENIMQDFRNTIIQSAS